MRCDESTCCSTSDHCMCHCIVGEGSDLDMDVSDEGLDDG